VKNEKERFFHFFHLLFCLTHLGLQKSNIQQQQSIINTEKHAKAQPRGAPV
jgi:hypothetical protein